MCSAQVSAYIQEEDDLDAQSDTRSVDALAHSSNQWVRSVRRRSGRLHVVSMFGMAKSVNAQNLLLCQNLDQRNDFRLEFFFTSVECVADFTISTIITIVTLQPHCFLKSPWYNWFQLTNTLHSRVGRHGHHGPQRLEDALDWRAVVRRYHKMQGGADDTPEDDDERNGTIPGVGKHLLDPVDWELQAHF